MIKRLLVPQRVRRINSSFAFIEHRFLQDGFLAALNSNELLLFFFLVLAADRDGLSFYSFDRICAALKMDTEDYIEARDALIDKDLIAFDGRFFQVLSLPERPSWEARLLLTTKEDMERCDPATVQQICRRAFGGMS